MAEVTEDNIGMRDEIMSTEHRPVHAQALYIHLHIRGVL